ncbi:MAG: hypothetical protein ACRDTC_11345 [Pseudonocardiaceae bacterium]
MTTAGQAMLAQLTAMKQYGNGWADDPPDQHRGTEPILIKHHHKTKNHRDAENS